MEKMNKLPKQLLCWWKGDAFFVDGKCVGTMMDDSALGFWGHGCTGIFRMAKTTSPINEWAEENNVRLFWRSSLKEIAGWL